MFGLFLFGAPKTIRTPNLGSEDLCDIHFTMGAKIKFIFFNKHTLSKYTKKVKQINLQKIFLEILKGL